MKRQAQFVSSGKVKSLEYLKKESVELSFTLCGCEVCDAGYFYSPRKRNYYMMFAMNKGKGICKANGDSHFMKENDMVLIFPGTEYSFMADQEEGCTLFWIGFMGMRAEECVMHCGFSRENPVRQTTFAKDMEELVEKMLKMKEMTFANDLRRNGFLKLYFAKMIDEYNSEVSRGHVKQEANIETSEHVKNAIAYISKNYSQDLKINDLADYVGVNRSYLASSFKKATGYSPKEYLLSLRMERAKSLLATTDMTINGISNAIGYSDQLAFSRMFKRYTGVSPSVYRGEHR